MDREIDRWVGLIQDWDNLFFSDKIIERKSQLEIHPHSDRWKLPSASSSSWSMENPECQPKSLRAALPSQHIRRH